MIKYAQYIYIFRGFIDLLLQVRTEGPVTLIQQVKIAYSLPHVMPKLFHPIIFSLSGQFYI